MQFSAIGRWRKPPCARRLQEQSVHPVGTPMPCAHRPAFQQSIRPPASPLPKGFPSKYLQSETPPRQANQNQCGGSGRIFAATSRANSRAADELVADCSSMVTKLMQRHNKGAQARCRTRTENSKIGFHHATISSLWVANFITSS